MSCDSSSRASDFTAAELGRAAASVAGRGDPLRDSAVLAEAKRRRERLTPAAAEAWERARERLRVAVPETTHRLWFEPLAAVGEHEDQLVLTGPRHVLRWVRRRYPQLLIAAVAEVSEFAGVAFEVPAK